MGVSVALDAIAADNDETRVTCIFRRLIPGLERRSVTSRIEKNRSEEGTFPARHTGVPMA